MPDPNLAGISRRSRGSTRPQRYWITTLDGGRLRQARIERGLSRDELAAGAGVSVRTMARLEGQRQVSCHRATLYRIAATLADDPEPVLSALVITDAAVVVRGSRVPQPAPVSSWLCSRVFPARPDQVAGARAFLGRVLHGCPMIYDAQVICSELLTNAVRHSRSGLPGGHVTVRAEVREHDYAWLEVEDQGGDWSTADHDDESGRGLEVVAALSDYWDIRGDDTRRMVCARLDWPGTDH
jgi:anti-sigma regulatory factor (Ser/Thr protein kinase)/DNA-binding XRE family transcriptional regulator